MTSLKERLGNFIKTFSSLEAQLAELEYDSEVRDIPAWQAINKITDSMIMMGYEYPWLMDAMQDENGVYLVISSGAKLYRVDYEVNANDEIAMQTPVEVKTEFVPVAQRERAVFRTMRNEQGDLLFIAISAAAVLNRVGEIDTRSLFSDFGDNFGEHEEPYLTLQHLPRAVSFGTVKGVSRHESLLIGWGIIDESTPLGAKAEERFAEGVWGISIGFVPTEDAEVINVGGVEIRTFNKGYLKEISVLKEERAASYFTNIVSVKKERTVSQQSRDQAKKLMLEFAGDDNEEAIDAILEEADLRERQITDDNLITREKPEDGVEDSDVETPVDDVTNEDDKEDTTEVTDETDEVDKVEVIEEVVELSQELVDSIVPKVVEEVRKIIKADMDEFNKQFETVSTEMSKVREFIEETTTSLRSRLDKVEETEDEKIRQAVEDLPSSKTRKTTYTYRPTSGENKEDEEDKPLSPKELRERTMSNANLNKES